MCKALLEEFRVEGSMYQMGRTRIFFRAGVLGHLEDTWARIQRFCTHTCSCTEKQDSTMHALNYSLRVVLRGHLQLAWGVAYS